MLAAATPAAAGPEITWSPRVEVAAGDARRGPWRMNESRFLYVDDPSVAIDGAGQVGVVWADQSRRDVFFQRFGPDGRAQLAPPSNVSRSGDVFSWLPRVVVAGENAREVYVLWQQIVFSGGSHGGEIFFARSGDGGRSFEPPRNLSRSRPGDGKGRLSQRFWDNGSLDLARAPDGTLIAAWTEYEGRLWVSRSTDGGRSFSAPRQLAGSGEAAPARAPALAAGPDGTVHLAWAVGEDDAADLRHARSHDGGASFDRAHRVHPGDGHADAPALAVDAAGNVHLAYAHGVEGRFGPHQVRYARMAPDGDRFAPPVVLSRPQDADADSTRSGSAGYPSIATGGEDGVYVVWELFPRPGARSQGLGFASSRDGGRRFSAPSTIPGTLDAALGFNAGLQGLLMRKIAANEDGVLAVVNASFRAGEASHVWLWRGRAGAR